MPLLLRSIYEDTKKRYHLELICGAAGLDGRMKWVYISEDLSTLSFLHGGELIITTGMGKTGDSWLYSLVEALSVRNTCGLILNIGKYLDRADITEEVRALCEQRAFPLFIMPWEIRIADITHDYYDRIFREQKAEYEVTGAFLDLLYGRGDPTESTALLERNGYPSDGCYVVCQIRYQEKNTGSGETISSTARDGGNLHWEKDIFPEVTARNSAWNDGNGNKENRAGPDETQLYTEAVQQMKYCNLSASVCRMPGYFWLIAPRISAEGLSVRIEEFLRGMVRHFPDLEFYAGIGNETASLLQIAQSGLYAATAASASVCRGHSVCAFSELGFLRILVTCGDDQVLEDYVRDQLGEIEDYDRTHGNHYLETLHQYLLLDGSVRKIAETLYCHRNTVNYRMRILKEELHLQLEDASVRFQLMAAFEVRDYLKIKGRCRR